MPRTWTEEQRQTARERGKRQWEGRKASVTVGPSAEQMLIAQAQATPPVQTEQNLQEVAGDDGMVKGARGGVSHTRPGRVAVYKPTPLGYRRREIPVTNLGMALANGFLPKCPQCGGECGFGINDCPGRPKRAYRQCRIPTCGHKVYDFQVEEMEDVETEDSMLIQDNAYLESTPALRTKAMLDKHMLVRHPTEAAAAGIVAPNQRAVEVPHGSAV